MARVPNPYGKSSLALSVMLHGALVAVAWFVGVHQQPEVMQFVAYEIEMVSPPATVQAEEPVAQREELVVERPDAEPAEPEVEEVVTVEEPEPEPEPTPPEPEPTPPEPEPAPPEPEEEPAPAAAPDATPDEDAEESGEDINVRLEGIRRDYPAYYRDIILQIQRCFRWQGGGNWETTVYFVIRRDGTVTDLDFLRRSGSAAFDFEAMGAIDCAGRGGFDPLPEDLPYERLPIQFNFKPTGSVRVQVAAADRVRANTMRAVGGEMR